MGLDYHFYFQRRTLEGWSVPANFINEFGNDEEGYFAWFDDKDIAMRLFRGEQALFPLRKEFPPEVERTWIFRRDPIAFREHFQGWLPFEELLLEDWEKTYLLIKKRIAASYASLFQNGECLFPRQGLLSAGLDAPIVQQLENTSDYVSDGELVAEPINYDFGQARANLERVSPERLMPVTWKVTISGFLGEWRTSAFRRLRQFGDEEELRILCLLS